MLYYYESLDVIRVIVLDMGSLYCAANDMKQVVFIKIVQYEW
jgi:hypothetical protein